MPTTTPPRLAKPTKAIFDPFNSSATGHQRADNTLSSSTSWRDSRTLKLRNQFKSGAEGGERVSDTVGAGSLDFGRDGRTANGGWVNGAKGLRKRGQQSIFESVKGVSVQKQVDRPAKRLRTEQSSPKPTVVVNPFTPFIRPDGRIRETSSTSHESSPSHLLSPIDPNSSTSDTPTTEEQEQAEASAENKPLPQIFANLVIYINGSTGPTISDQKLKHILSSHGARLSIALGRRTVTHVIIGRPSGAGGSGGGLSGSKIQKEVTRVGGKPVKFVTAEWVLESVKAGKRLPELRFAALNLGPKGVASAFSMFGQHKQPTLARQPRLTMEGESMEPDHKHLRYDTSLDSRIMRSSKAIRECVQHI